MKLACDFCVNKLTATVDAAVKAGWYGAVIKYSGGHQVRVTACPEHKEQWTSRLKELREAQEALKLLEAE